MSQKPIITLEAIRAMLQELKTKIPNYNVVSKSANGLAPMLPDENNIDKFLR